MNSPQDSSGEETKNDSRRILEEILAPTSTKTGPEELKVKDEIQLE